MGKQELLDRARDELFSHIHRCGVLQATEQDQDAWMTETIEYLAERYPDLGVAELGELKTVGLRFCQPVISRLKKEEPAEATTETEGEAGTESAGAETVESGTDGETTAESTADDPEAAVGAA